MLYMRQFLVDLDTCIYKGIIFYQTNDNVKIFYTCNYDMYTR